MDTREAAVQKNALPFRTLARVVLILIGLISLYTAIGFLLLRSHIPLWFVPFFLLLIGFMTASAAAYWRMLAAAFSPAAAFCS